MPHPSFNFDIRDLLVISCKRFVRVENRCSAQVKLNEMFLSPTKISLSSAVRGATLTCVRRGTSFTEDTNTSSPSSMLKLLAKVVPRHKVSLGLGLALQDA